jgi:hypothetical protein
MVNESVCIVIALVQKAVSDHKPAIAATFRLVVQKMFAILPCTTGSFKPLIGPVLRLSPICLHQKSNFYQGFSRSLLEDLFRIQFKFIILNKSPTPYVAKPENDNRMLNVIRQKIMDEQTHEKNYSRK